MTKHTMLDGTQVETKKALDLWDEATYPSGDTFLSVNTGNERKGQCLYLSPDNRYYLVHYVRRPVHNLSAEYITDKAAIKWLKHNRHTPRKAK